MALNWVFPNCGNFSVTGADIVEDNFSNEESPPVNIFLRELVQNTLDARPNNSSSVRLVVKETTVPVTVINSIFNEEFLDRLDASEKRRPDMLNISKLLLVEDFGTTGLSGKWDNQNYEGESEHWNAFWFKEGEGTKMGKGANGSAGQGKITFYKMSQLRTIIGYTVRYDDKAQLLMGRSHFSRDYSMDGCRFQRHSFWSCDNSSPRPLEAGVELDGLVSEIGFIREKNEPGFSMAIPCPGEIDETKIIFSLAAEFYYPVKFGKLIFEINGKSINQETIDMYANSFTNAQLQQSFSVFTSTMRDFICATMSVPEADKFVAKSHWCNNPIIESESFEDGVIKNLIKKFEEGNLVAVRFPVTVSSIKDGKKDSYFDVYLQSPANLQKSEEAFIRKDLVIGSERHISSGGHFRKSRTITHINDDVLSAFLADAEEPTHLKWNSRRKRLNDRFKNCDVLLRNVRNAAARLLNHLSGVSETVDRRTLGSYFPKPGDHEGPMLNGKNKKAKPKREVIGPELPSIPSLVKPFKLEDTPSGVRVILNSAVNLTSIKFPILCDLSIAYVHGNDADHFKQYHPLDFDLGNSKLFPIVNIGDVLVVNSEKNMVKFTVSGPIFTLEVGGLDPNLSHVQKLRYSEVSKDEIDQPQN